MEKIKKELEEAFEILAQVHAASMLAKKGMSYGIDHLTVYAEVSQKIQNAYQFAKEEEEARHPDEQPTLKEAE
jgi:hypothetical protein